MNRTANEDEAAESTADRQRRAAMLVTEIALGVAKVPVSAHPAGAIGAEIEGFAEARGDGFTPADDVRRNASLYLLSQLVDSPNSDLELSDIDDLAISESSDGTRRVASGIHEIYSRDLSMMDAEINPTLKENEIILNQNELRENPDAAPETVTAHEFITNYTQSHGEQYDEIIENHRARTAQEIAEMIGR
ncbi:hypothetical protein AB0I72_11910 [Nocardiopsis sp. NPDC049922]|uniref:hypothetical protein n=1 Tax=Nocardiopsis sp. NPDC049922 TaxID=3155157 RepID=UPI00340F2065